MAVKLTFIFMHLGLVTATSPKCQSTNSECMAVPIEEPSAGTSCSGPDAECDVSEAASLLQHAVMTDSSGRMSQLQDALQKSHEQELQKSKEELQEVQKAKVHESLSPKYKSQKDEAFSVRSEGVGLRSMSFPNVKIFASDAQSDDQFGYQVALSGDTALIAAKGSLNSGKRAAYIFLRDGSSWTEHAKLVPPEEDACRKFGLSMALDGDTALIGAEGNNDRGSAYIFVRDGSFWTRQAKLTPTVRMGFDGFGAGVALEGDLALIGAPGTRNNGIESGSAYIFVRNSDILTGQPWTEQAQLTPTNAIEVSGFGISVALSGDTALIGAPDVHGHANGFGAAFVFVRNGVAWSEHSRLMPNPGVSFDKFGLSVALAGDNALIGAPFSTYGAAYIFARSGDAWTERAKLTANDEEAGVGFGWTVALEGNVAWIGKQTKTGSEHGAVYIFTFDGSTWTEEAALTASDGTRLNNFGCNVAVAGGIALVGASKDNDRGDNSGSAYMFEVPDLATVTKCLVPESPPGTVYAPGCAAGQMVPYSTRCTLNKNEVLEAGYDCDGPGTCKFNGQFEILHPVCQPRDLQVSGLCIARWGVDYNGRYRYMGNTLSGAPYYQKVNLGDFFLYHDPNCNGDSSPGRWIFDNHRPSTAVSEDLDGDGVCYYHARINSDTVALPPLGTFAWRQQCRMAKTQSTGQWTTLLANVQLAVSAS